MRAILLALMLLMVLPLVGGCEPSAANSPKELIELVKRGKLDEVRKTIESDRSLANLKRRDGLPLLYFAVVNGHLDTVTYLLDMGAQIDARTQSGSALHGAADNEFADIAEVLLARGANPHLRDDSGQTPLHKANMDQSGRVAAMLISSGADINAIDLQGRTALHRCKSKAVAKLLVEKRADVNATDNNGYTPLHWFATPREIVDRPTVEYLLANGADASLVDHAGLTPRQLAKENGQHELISILDALNR
jgi:ankyrin repeat protein